MAHITLLSIAANEFVGDNDAQLVAGDAPAPHTSHKGRPAVALDDTDEEAFVTPERPMPASYGGGTLKATIHFSIADAVNDIALDVFVEAKTPNADELNMQTATSWDSANSGTKSLSATVARDPVTLDITLTNKDSVAAGDLVRFGVRRDCDSVNDDATTDLYIYAIEIWEDA